MKDVLVNYSVHLLAAITAGIFLHWLWGSPLTKKTLILVNKETINQAPTNG